MRSLQPSADSLPDQPLYNPSLPLPSHPPVVTGLKQLHALAPTESAGRASEIRLPFTL
ncbi:hypothetical protein BAUCODRAFT_125900 [Baudoinia panamericana UAMH 10762]|uniref:Uncharacterized protein n=1 Tax=Baudoinia panamericana (strain UAMH 10762) TaxID=717646 RepID=M2N2R8_BAUPA|nr:uncharacterized protein BAUCODRAFT_125900 [Baudoinia panamericana UAMH 10762]EMC92955.1 hypothetical protein BAUCODRAFT_125900 [Baudoinia panamericana UAMH 10762]